MISKIVGFFFGDLRGWLITGAILGIAFWVIAFPIFESKNARQLEQEQAPLVAELENFKRSNGKYPEALDSLVPKYLAELPRCPISRRPGYWFDTTTGSYELRCPTFLFTVRTYKSTVKKWEISSD